jgi:hypothetical protein
MTEKNTGYQSEELPFAGKAVELVLGLAAFALFLETINPVAFAASLVLIGDTTLTGGRGAVWMLDLFR